MITNYYDIDLLVVYQIPNENLWIIVDTKKTAIAPRDEFTKISILPTYSSLFYHIKHSFDKIVTIKLCVNNRLYSLHFVL